MQDATQRTGKPIQMSILKDVFNGVHLASGLCRFRSHVTRRSESTLGAQALRFPPTPHAGLTAGTDRVTWPSERLSHNQPFDMPKGVAGATAEGRVIGAKLGGK